jgi:hypothetical protein
MGGSDRKMEHESRAREMTDETDSTGKAGLTDERDALLEKPVKAEREMEEVTNAHGRLIRTVQELQGMERL